MRNLFGYLVLAVLGLWLWRIAPAAVNSVRLARAEGSKPVSHTTQKPAAAGPALRVLFVGNSHTYFNDMPGSVQQLAAAGGETRRFEAGQVTAGGATLQDHLSGPHVRERLSAERWDYVVLQEQQQRPTWPQPYLEKEFFAPVRTLDVLIRAASARTLLYMTPARLDGDRPGVPDDTYERMQERSRLNHVRLGVELSALVAPVGVAWAKAHRAQPELPLWAADRYHPSAHGSYLTACVFYGLLFQRKATGNSYHAGLPASDAAALQRAADSALSPSEGP